MPFRFPVPFMRLMFRTVFLFAFRLFSSRFPLSQTKLCPTGAKHGALPTGRNFRLAARATLEQFLRLACGGLAATALLACTPTYDWRTVTNNDSGYTVDLPARPGTDDRRVDIDGMPMQMHMQTAEADHVVFAVGTLTLPSGDPQLQQKVLDFLRDGMARNVGAQPSGRAVQIPLAAGGAVLGFEMTLSGKAGPKQEPRMIHVRLVAKGTHVYQAAVIASKEPAPEQIDQFFGSFKLY